MDDTTAFDRQIATEVLREVGPLEPVNDLALFNTILAATQSPKWRVQSMFSATKFVVAGVIVALFGGFLFATVLPQHNDQRPIPGAVDTSPSPAPTPGSTRTDSLGATSQTAIWDGG